MLRFDGDADVAMLGFIPAAVASRVAALRSLVTVPGAPPQVLGVALADGAVVTVLRIGERRVDEPRYQADDPWPVPGARRAVICHVGAVDVALSGGVVVATGVFDAAPVGEGILWRGQMVPELDVRALYAQAEAATWAGRAASVRPRVPSAPIPPEPIEDEDARPAWLPGEVDDR